ncbi:1,2-glucosyltransferase WapB [Pseudomonas aeruginosa]|uniref:1,2-glucosyltransferase WapB n=1 Tax=Pseudomonas aeruginosa TaxID=287 RepID=UPI003C0B0120
MWPSCMARFPSSGQPGYRLVPSPGAGAGEEEMRPLVSVVCACFNISKYLDEAIASIYAQGYPNLELIVVDDGSTDDTYERLAMLRERHGFQLYRQANRGVSDALNHGLRHARGEFVMTPDLDDILLPGALDTRVDYLLAHPEVGCVGGFNICIGSAGNEVARDGFSEGCVERWGFDAALAETLVVMPLTALYRMDAMKRADFFDPSIRVQDFQITLRIAAQGYEIHRLPAYMGRYRRHGSGLSGRYKLNYEADMQAIEPYRAHPNYRRARQLILNKALKKAVVQDGRYAWQLFRSVPLRAWDRVTLKRFWRFLRYLPVLGLKGGTDVAGR